MAVPAGAADVESEPLFEDETFFAAPAQSAYAALAEVDAVEPDDVAAAVAERRA